MLHKFRGGGKKEVGWGRGVAEKNAKLPNIAPSTLFSLVLPCKLTFFLENVKMLQIF